MENNIIVNELNISPMGLGVWQIGDRLFWSYGKTHQYEDARAVIKHSINLGINFLDTAEIYGFGNSEKVLGRLLKELDLHPVIATKYFPFPWRISRSSMVSAIKNSLYRLKLDYVDIYQIHWPFLSFFMHTWTEGFSDIVRDGLTRYVGVSNFNRNQVRKMHSLLQNKGINLVSNQLEYNLLNRSIELNGLMYLCKSLGIKVIAYSPLGQGLLTGKYNIERPKSGIRKYRIKRLDQGKLQIFVDFMRKIGKKYGDKSPAQVAINWVICKGAIPIPGSKTAHQAIENAGALGWRLDNEDIERLDNASDRVNEK